MDRDRHIEICNMSESELQDVPEVELREWVAADVETHGPSFLAMKLRTFARNAESARQHSLIMQSAAAFRVEWMKTYRVALNALLSRTGNTFNKLREQVPETLTEQEAHERATIAANLAHNSGPTGAQGLIAGRIEEQT